MSDTPDDDAVPAPMTDTAPTRHDNDDDDPETLSVADPVLGKTRRLSRQCPTCIFHPGNPMHLEPGALKDLIDSALAQDSYVVCHETLPGMAPPGYAPAVCRGFHDRYTTGSLRVIARLWGFVDVDPPSTAAGTHTVEARLDDPPCHTGPLT
jgi:hypothetical protein